MTVKIEKHTAKMLGRVLKQLKPPPRLTLSQWADGYRFISPESSANPGKWRTDRAPYQREIMDAIGDPHVSRVVVMSAAQIGKTDGFILNPIGYYVDYTPAPIMCMEPTIAMGESLSKEKLAPMIRDTPVLRNKIRARGRDSGNTIMQKVFPGGHVTIVGANSPSSLASRPIKLLLADEIDRYPPSAGTEGDPLALAEKRQTTFWDKKTVMVSTPTLKETSRIAVEFEHSTKEEWNIPCPHCGEYQPMVWANLLFDQEDLERIQYRCAKCGCLAGEYEWKGRSRLGKFVAEKPEEETRGFHLNTLSSPFCSWKEVVEKFLKAKEQLDRGDTELMKVWVNTELGETWEEQGEVVENDELFARREPYGGVVPADVLVLTAGVDTQDDRFEVEVVGWGEGKESWGIRYQKIYGDMKQQQVYDDLDEFLKTTFLRADGTVLEIAATAIDTGGHHSVEVERFCADRFVRRIFAIKGSSRPDAPYISRHSRNNRPGTPMWNIGVNTGKCLMQQRLKLKTPGPGYCHFPMEEEAGYDEIYFKGLTAEKMVVRFKKGRSVIEWDLRDRNYKRNEPWDLRNYATAALEIMNPVLTKDPQPRAARSTRRKRSGGIGG